MSVMDETKREQFLGVLFEMIGSGGFSSADLEHIADVCYAQRRLQDAAQAAHLRRGDKVVVIDKVKPRYLAGASGVVGGRSGDRIEVTFDSSNLDYRVRGKTWRMSLGSIRKVPAEEAAMTA